MLRLIINMFRLFFRLIGFFAGVAAGVWLALMVLPLPGTTLFNKMSRLPKNLKNLIDDSVDLFGACFNFGQAVVKDVNQQIHLLNTKIQERMNKSRFEFDEDASLEDVEAFAPKLKKIEVTNGHKS